MKKLESRVVEQLPIDAQADNRCLSESVDEIPTEHYQHCMISELFPLADKRYVELNDLDRDTVDWVLQYEDSRHRSVRKMLFRLALITDVCLFLSGSMNSSICLGGVLFLWQQLEDLVSSPGAFFLESLIPTFGYETKKNKARLEEHLQRRQLDQAYDYNFEMFVRDVLKHRSQLLGPINWDKKTSPVIQDSDETGSGRDDL